MAAKKTPSREDVINILESTDFEPLKGCEEGLQFEFKKKRPYDFVEDVQKNTLAMAEFAKDVASFANSEGGVIVCGLLRKDPSEIDLVEGYDFISEENFYKEQDIIGRIKLSIVPIMENVSVKWFPSKADPKMGLGAIIIPAQQEEKKYFVVRVCAVEEETLKGIYFGIPIRKEAKPDWVDLKDMKYMRQKNLSNTEKQHIEVMDELKGIKSSLSGLKASADNKSALEDRMEELING